MTPRPGLEPVTIAIHAVLGLAALAGIAWVAMGLLSSRETPVRSAAPITPAPRAAAPAPAPPATKPPAAAEAPRVAPAAPAPTARSAATSRASGTPGAAAVAPGPADGSLYVYAVTLQPPAWRNAELAYRSRRQADGRLSIEMAFEHGAGERTRSTWAFGVFERGHATHANVRFPGFFMHAAYFPEQLEAGRRFSWAYAWQAAGGAVHPGRERRFDAVIVGPEAVQVPAGRFEATRIEVTVSYVEAGRAAAMVRETLWYAPAAGQLVKVVRDGRSPDEPAQHIVAELKAVSGR